MNLSHIENVLFPTLMNAHTMEHYIRNSVFWNSKTTVYRSYSLRLDLSRYANEL